MRLFQSIIFCFLFLPFFAEAQKEYMCIDPESEDDEPVYVERVEKKPAYPGGDEELLKDIQENLVYPEDAKKDSIQGYVLVRFVIDKEGHITNREILKFDYAYIDSPAFDSAALDVLSHLKTFIPGEQHGKKVNVYYTLPIMFKLDK